MISDQKEKLICIVLIVFNTHYTSKKILEITVILYNHNLFIYYIPTRIIYNNCFYFYILNNNFVIKTTQYLQVMSPSYKSNIYYLSNVSSD